jgi:hypothetical protein
MANVADATLRRQIIARIVRDRSREECRQGSCIRTGHRVRLISSQTKSPGDAGARRRDFSFDCGQRQFSGW